jgi:hypothetical protein
LHAKINPKNPPRPPYRAVHHPGQSWEVRDKYEITLSVFRFNEERQAKLMAALLNDVTSEGVRVSLTHDGTVYPDDAGYGKVVDIEPDGFVLVELNPGNPWGTTITGNIYGDRPDTPGFTESEATKTLKTNAQLYRALSDNLRLRTMVVRANDVLTKTQSLLRLIESALPEEGHGQNRPNNPR